MIIKCEYCLEEIHSKSLYHRCKCGTTHHFYQNGTLHSKYADVKINGSVFVVEKEIITNKTKVFLKEKNKSYKLLLTINDRTIDFDPSTLTDKVKKILILL